MNRSSRNTTDDRRRVLVLTAGFGEGHNTAARNMAAAFDERLGQGSALMADCFALAAPKVNRLCCNAYLQLINRAPQLWGALYRWLEHSALPEQVLNQLRAERAVLKRLILEHQPVAICSTYPAYSRLLRRLAQEGLQCPPHFVVVTDSISIHPLWWRVPAAGWYVPNIDSREVMCAAGVDTDRIHAAGFPTALRFARRLVGDCPPDLASGGRPRVLLMANSGMRNARALIQCLIGQRDWEVTFAVGRDEKIRAEIALWIRRAGSDAKVIGWTDQIPRLLLTHHLVISKAGGATTQEAIAACCPMIISQVVPGQEQGNAELLRRNQIGRQADTVDAVMETCRQVFAGEGRVWVQWRERLRQLSRPTAALDIADHILGQLEEGSKER